MTFLVLAFGASLLPPADSVVLSNRCGSAEIAFVGAQVVSYRPVDRGEVLFLPQDHDFTRNREMHGGIPVCWPWFGRLGAPGSRMHGLARYARWALDSVSNEVEQSTAVLTLASSDETRRVWPYDFALRYEISLGPQLRLRLTATNTDTRSFSLTAGFHPYFRVADPARVVVRGMSEPVSVFAGIDQGFYTPSNGRYKFATGFAEVEMAAKGECRLVVWNPGADWSDWRPECNLGKDDWCRFVCVEPTISRRDRAITLRPGECHTMEMTLDVFGHCNNMQSPLE